MAAFVLLAIDMTLLFSKNDFMGIIMHALYQFFLMYEYIV